MITGGEPTLHRGLIPFLIRCRELGYHIKLDTNGSRPDAVTHLIDGDLVDLFALDIKTSPQRYHHLTGRIKAHSQPTPAAQPDSQF